MTALQAGLLGCAALTSAGAGFVALSLAMERHLDQLLDAGAAPARLSARLRGRLLRRAGLLGLAASLLSCLGAWGNAQGWVAWAGALTTGALATALALTYATRAVARLGWAAAAATALLLAGARLAGG